MKLEAKAFLLVLVVALFMFLGSWFTMIVPLTDPVLNTPSPGAKDYTALEMKGKKVYQREGCWYCHTQQVRNLLEETRRYGMGEEETFKRFGIRALIQAPPTQPGEIAFDKPHQLGTRRAGPDLARVGGKYDNSWHINHFRDPRSTSPGSLMPAYTWLFDKNGQPTEEVIALVAYMQKLGSNIPWREQGVEQARKLQASLPPSRNDQMLSERSAGQ
jgi:cytochrome c oxidase cbb3-type subunit I/II